MRFRARWILVLVALFALAPPASAEDGDDDDDEGDGPGSHRRGCGPLPVRVEDVPCETLNDPCEPLSGEKEPCEDLHQRPKNVCLSVTFSPPGYSYDVDCLVKYALKEVRTRTGLDEWDLKAQLPVKR